MILLLTSCSKLNSLGAIHGLTQLVLIIFGMHYHSNLGCLWGHRMQEWRLLLDFPDKHLWRAVFKDFIIMVPWDMVSILDTTFVLEYSIVTYAWYHLSKSLAWIVIDQLVMNGWIATLILVFPLDSSRLLMIYFKLIIYLLPLLMRLQMIYLLFFLFLFLRHLYLLELFLTLMNDGRWLNNRHHVLVGILIARLHL